MRTFRRALLLCASALCLAAALPTSASAQALTSFTSTALNAGTGPVTGKVCLTATDMYGNPISVSVAGVGFYLKGRPFCGTLTAGALVGTLNVPNSATDSARGHGYDIVVYDTVNNIQTDLGVVYGVQGASWAIDTYVPSTTVPTASAFTYTVSASNPSGACVAPALYSNSTTGVLYQCLGGVWVAAAPPIGTASGTVAAGNDARIVASLKDQGTYSSGVIYNLDDVVLSGGIRYLSLAGSNSGNTPASNPIFWSPIGSGTGATSTQAGTSYTLQPADCVANTPTVTFTSTTGVAITLPTTGFLAGCTTRLKNLGGSGSSLVLTPASGQIDAVSSLSILYPGDGVIQWDGTTWKAFGGYGVRGASQLAAFQAPYVPATPGSLAGVSCNGLVKYSTTGVATCAAAGTDYAAANEPLAVAAQATANAAAPLASPAFSGAPTAPTQTAGDTSTKLATDGFVAAAVTNGANGGTLTGDVTKTAGSTATSVVKINAGSVPVTNGFPAYNKSGQLIVLPIFASYNCLGNSYIQGVGVVQAGRDSACALIGADTPAISLPNYGLQGTMSQDIARSALLNFVPNNNYPSVILSNLYENDANNETCNSVVGTPNACTRNAAHAGYVLMGLTIPPQYRVYASNAALTGTTATDTTIPLFVTPYQSQGTAKKCTAGPCTYTFTLPVSSAATAVGLTYVVTNSASATFAATADASSLTDDCSGTTTFSAGPCGGLTLLTNQGITSTAHRQRFTVSASGSAHTLVVTAQTGVIIISADIAPPAGTANTNWVFTTGMTSNFGVSGATGSSVVYDALAKTIIAQSLADGGINVLVDTRNGLLGTNLTRDISTSVGPNNVASTSANHPNVDGYRDFAQDVRNAEQSSGYIFSEPGAGGKWTGASGQIAVPIAQVIGSSAGATHAQVTNYLGGNIDFFDNVSTAIGMGFATDSTTGHLWSSKNMTVAYVSSGGMNCTRLWNSNTTLAAAADSQYVTHSCTGVDNGNLMTDGMVFFTGLAPSIVAGAGAGTSPTVAIAGTNAAGVITVTAGTSPSASAILGTISFNVTNYQSVIQAPKGCSVFPQNAASAGISLYLGGAPSTTAWVLDVGATALTASTSYSWSYSCF